VSLLGRRAPLASAAAGLAWRLGGFIWLGTVLLAMSSGLLMPAGAWLLKSAVDELTRPGPSLMVVAALAAATVMLQGLSLGLGSLSTLTAAAAQRRMSVAVASDLYQAVNAISGLTKFDDPGFQDSLRLAEESAERVPAALTDMLGTLLQGGTVVVSFAGLLISIWPPMLALVALACLPNVAVQVSLARHSARTSEANASRFRQWVLLRGLLTDPRSVPEIRLLGSGDFFRGRLVSALRDARTAEYEVRRRIAWAQGGLAVVGAAITAIGAVVIAEHAARHQLSVGDLVMFLAAVSGIQAALLSTLNQAMMVGSGLRLLRHYVSVVAGKAGPVPAQRRGPGGDDQHPGAAATRRDRAA
jgi:ATP-binding cassette, subfamily B, bacterial